MLETCSAQMDPAENVGPQHFLRSFTGLLWSGAERKVVSP